MPASITHEERVALTRRVLEVLGRWGVEPMEQGRLLGLPAPNAGRRFRQLHLGQELPDDPALWERVALLLGIDNALNQVFPHSALSANIWVTTPSARLGHRTPLDLMLEGGLEAIRQIQRSLDHPDLL